MTRLDEYDPDRRCERCGELGSFMFWGQWLCEACREAARRRLTAWRDGLTIKDFVLPLRASRHIDPKMREVEE